jgi:signal peptide peptidase SppA
MEVGIPGRLFNSALMVAPQAVDEMLKVNNTGRNDTGPAAVMNKLQAFAEIGSSATSVDAGYMLIDGVALIEISGGLTYRGYGWWNTTYSEIRNRFRMAMADERVGRIVLLIDSPGGEVGGVFDLVDEIYQARGTKPMIAVVDEIAFSAAYMIASAADRVYLPATGQVGSIGVIAIHVDQSGFDRNLGLCYTAVYAGNHKNDYSPHKPLNPEAMDALQAHVDKLYGMFAAVVARNRGIPQAAVMDTQAGIFLGDAAVAAGLADGVLPVREIIENMISGEGEIGMNLNEVKNVVNQALVESMVEVKQMLESIEARLMGNESGQPEVSEPDTTTLAGDIVELCEVSGMPELAGVMIRDGMTIEAAKRAILDARAKAATDTGIVSTVGAMTFGEGNPVLEDAKKRAGGVMK